MQIDHYSHRSEKSQLKKYQLECELNTIINRDEKRSLRCLRRRCCLFRLLDRRLSVKLHSEGGETINLHSFEKQTNDLNKLKMRCSS